MGQNRRWPMTITDEERQFFVELGARIGELRQQHGYTQVQLAHDLGIAQQTLNSFERGVRRVPASTLPKLSKLLRVPIGELLGEEPQKSRRRGPKPRIQQQLEEVSQLPKAQQKVVAELIETFVRANS